MIHISIRNSVLLVSLFLAAATNAQTLVWQENFDSTTVFNTGIFGATGVIF